MHTRSRFFDDVARVAGGALSVFSGLHHEVDVLVRNRLDRLVARMDLVSRDEFEAIKGVAAAARTKADTLEEKLVALEEHLCASTPSKDTPSRGKEKTAHRKQP